MFILEISLRVSDSEVSLQLEILCVTTTFLFNDSVLIGLFSKQISDRHLLLKIVAVLHGMAFPLCVYTSARHAKTIPTRACMSPTRL